VVGVAREASTRRCARKCCTGDDSARELAHSSTIESCPADVTSRSAAGSVGWRWIIPQLQGHGDEPLLRRRGGLRSSAPFCVAGGDDAPRDARSSAAVLGLACSRASSIAIARRRDHAHEPDRRRATRRG
jgi:hypothetical protein